MYFVLSKDPRRFDPKDLVLYAPTPDPENLFVGLLRIPIGGPDLRKLDQFREMQRIPLTPGCSGTGSVVVWILVFTPEDWMSNYKKGVVLVHGRPESS